MEKIEAITIRRSQISIVRSIATIGYRIVEKESHFWKNELFKVGE
jgi:hypothetical protein